MNRKLFPLRLPRPPRLTPAVLLLIATAGEAGVTALDATEDMLPSKTPYVLRIGPESTGPRLRCWQHGVPVVDEPLADDAAAPAAPSTTPLLTAPSVGGRQMLVLAGGTGLCLLTREPLRIPAASLMK